MNIIKDKYMKISKATREEMFLFALIAIMSVINISLMNNDSVWCDEAYTMIQCKSQYHDMIKNLLVDAWPPFYGFTSWVIAQIFGATVPVLKIFSFVPTLLIMMLGATYIKKEFKSIWVSTFFILLIGIMPISVHMSVEIRGYSWGLFFVTFCGILAYQYYKYGHNWKTFFLMIIVGLLAAYTHYFALVSVALVYMILFLFFILKDKKNIKFCLGITVFCFLGYLPWLSCFLKAAKSVSSGYWIPSVSVTDFLQYFWYPFTYSFDNFGRVTKCEFTFIFIALLICLTLVQIGIIYKNKIKNSLENVFALSCLSVWILTIVLGFVVSRIVSPMFIARYMYFSVGLLWLFIALSCKHCISDKRVLVSVAALILAAGMYGYIEQRVSEFENGTEEAKKIVEEHFEKGMGIFSDSDYLNWTEIKYYFPESIHSELGANTEIITDEGNRSKFLFMATKDFSEYSKEFIDLGYNIEYIGSYNFDNSYYFLLYKMEKVDI